MTNEPGNILPMPQAEPARGKQPRTPKQKTSRNALLAMLACQLLAFAFTLFSSDFREMSAPAVVFPIFSTLLVLALCLKYLLPLRVTHRKALAVLLALILVCILIPLALSIVEKNHELENREVHISGDFGTSRTYGNSRRFSITMISGVVMLLDTRSVPLSIAISSIATLLIAPPLWLLIGLAKKRDWARGVSLLCFGYAAVSFVQSIFSIAEAEWLLVTAAILPIVGLYACYGVLLRGWPVLAKPVLYSDSEEKHDPQDT